MDIKQNYTDSFFRDLTLCLLDTLEGKIKWVNRFTSGDIEVNCPFYYSMSGDERFLLDAFKDDIVSNSRFNELNVDKIPRGHITLNDWNIKSDEFRNPNQWLRNTEEISGELRTTLRKVRAIPIKASYGVNILLKTEIDIFKASEAIMNLLWLYRIMYFEYKYMRIDAIMITPDSSSITISREKSMTSDNNIEIKFDLEVHTYYPSFVFEEVAPSPMRTKWYNNFIEFYNNLRGK